MRNIILIAISVFLFSCSKESRPDNTLVEPYYIGTYNSSNGDTSYVSSGTGGYIVIRWAARSGNSMVFDSVNITADNTFSDNEFVDYGGVRHSLGMGNFIPQNSMYFKFILDNNAQIIFNGIKK